MAELTQFGNSMCNCYLLRGPRGSVLVDTGPGQEREAIYKKIADQNVRLILLTHGHVDHRYNAAVFADRLQVPIAMHRADLPLLEANGVEGIQADTFGGKALRFFSGLLGKTSAVESFAPSIFLQEGDRLDDWGVDASVHELPGHTKGGLGVLSDDDSYLLVGDVFMHWTRPAPAHTYEDKEELDRSVERVLRSPARRIYVGHGKSFTPEEYLGRERA